MSDAHNHADHAHTPNKKSVLIISFIVITAYMLIEFIGGILTNSLALLSDAGHMLSDSISLGIALAAVYLGQKAINQDKSFGYRRFEILAAAINGLTLMGIAVYIFVEAAFRFQNPEPINVKGMFIISSIGLLINIVVAWFIFKNSDTENDLNMRGAYLHVMSDLLGSIGAITAALCLYFFGWAWADSLASVLVAVLVLRSGIQVTKSASHVLMQGTPKNFNMDDIQQHILNHQDILEVHDLHLWSISNKSYVLSCHIIVDDQKNMQQVQEILNTIEHQMFDLGIEHTTIQTETQSHHHQNIQACITEQAHDHDHHPH